MWNEKERIALGLSTPLTLRTFSKKNQCVSTPSNVELVGLLMKKMKNNYDGKIVSGFSRRVLEAHTVILAMLIARWTTSVKWITQDLTHTIAT